MPVPESEADFWRQNGHHYAWKADGLEAALQKALAAVSDAQARSENRWGPDWVVGGLVIGSFIFGLLVGSLR